MRTLKIDGFFPEPWSSLPIKSLVLTDLRQLGLLVKPILEDPRLVLLLENAVALERFSYIRTEEHENDASRTAISTVLKKYLHTLKTFTLKYKPEGWIRLITIGWPHYLNLGKFSMLTTIDIDWQYFIAFDGWYHIRTHLPRCVQQLVIHMPFSVLVTDMTISVRPVRRASSSSNQYQVCAQMEHLQDDRVHLSLVQLNKIAIIVDISNEESPNVSIPHPDTTEFFLGPMDSYS